MNVNQILHANIYLSEQMSAPDSVSLTNEFPTSLSHVISRNINGKVISIYSDDVWDFSCYDKKNRRCVLSFNHWTKGNKGDFINHAISDLKKLVFAFIWYRDGKKHQVKNISNLGPTLNSLARYCLDKRITISELLISEKHLSNCLMALKPGSMYDARRFLLSFNDVNKNKPFEICDIKKLAEMNDTIISYRKNIKQFPPIPPRIYLSYIENITSDINLLMASIDDLLNLLVEIKANNTEIRKMKSNAKHINIASKYIIENIITSHNLDFLFDTFHSKKNINGVMYLLNSVLFRCRLAVQMFTGMRIDEATNLNTESAKIHHKNGRLHYIIHGKTTKLMEREAKWVTNEIGYNATCIAKRISNFIISQIDGYTFENVKRPLFVRTSYIGLTKNEPKIERNTLLNASLAPYDEMKKIGWLNIHIKKEDISELKKIDPFRSWESESKFEIGKYWPLQTHQFRRSLALYASRSGLVTLTSLRRQFQHLSTQMTLYYSRGSEFAQNLILDDKSHFAAEFQEIQSYAQALDYVDLILLSDNRLFGAQGNILNNHFKNNTLMDKNETIKLFKLGQMAYTETCLGGCTTLEKCTQRATRSLVSCLSCENAIIKKDKLELVIKAQHRLLGKIDKESLTYRTEAQDLQLLEKYLDICNSKSGGK